MGTKANLIGKIFYRLTVLEETSERKNGSVVWKCSCSCGKIINVSISYLKTGHKKSCGCLLQEQLPDMIGKKFSKLIVLDEVTDGPYKKKKARTWRCLCDCGKITYQITNSLNGGHIGSCGCQLHQKIPQKDLTGQKFGRLTVIAPELGQNRKSSFTWKCVCDCGKITHVATNTLTSEHIKSCGCGEWENKLENCRRGREQQTLNRKDPMLALAEWIFNKNYSDGDLLFKDFLEMSQKNCHYCDSPPSNDLKFSSRGKTKEYRDASRFIYNGLDRTNPSTKAHMKSEVVPCCMNCNFAKLNYEYNIFISMFSNINKTSTFGRKVINIPSENELKSYLLSKLIYKINTSKFCPAKYIVRSQIGNYLDERMRGRKAKSAKFKYNDGDLTFDQFCYLVLQPCWYCGNPASNRIKYPDKNGKEQLFPINGIDRLDNSLPHLLTNCVPCCKYCNYAKRKRPYKEFLSWAESAYQNLKKKNVLP